MSSDDPHAGHEEDLIDRWIHRRLAHPVALVGAWLGIHPNTVTLLGMSIGIGSGWFFQYHEASSVMIGVALLFVATILDNADGQLARMTGKSSEFGYVLDGICDNFVFIAVYGFSIFGIWPQYGFLGFVLGFAAGVSHSFQSAMLDFYKLQYRYYARGIDRDRFKTPTQLALDESATRGIGRVFLRIRGNYARQQRLLSSTRLSLAPAWEGHRASRQFRERYFRLNLAPLRGWFLMGPNWHLVLIYICGFLGRMDWFFWATLVPLNLILLGNMLLQSRRDHRLSAELA